MKERILILDDDFYFVKEMEASLKKFYSIESVYTIEEFYKKFVPYLFDLVFLDLKLGGKEEDKKKGVEILKYIKETSPSTPVIILTAFADVDSAIACLKLGASDYLKKVDVDKNSLLRIIANTLERESLKRRLKNLETNIQKENPWELIGESKAIKQVKEQIKLVAEDAEIDVLITGETGTGKELAARSIHHLGRRKRFPFTPLNLSVYPKEILYSEIFGHERGAFTGAITKKIGAFEASHKGIVFLDEIKEASLEIQVSLLRFLETREFRRLGGNKTLKVNLQVIFATNKDLKEAAKRGEFREDLFYRINRFEIHLPPLRERKEDIEILTQHFLELFRKTGRSKVREIDKEVLEVFMDYSWPGNVRELKNIIEAAVIRAKSNNVINLSHIPSYIVTSREKETSFNFKKKMLEKEMKEIEEILKKTGFHKAETAKLIGYHRSHLTRKIKRVFRENPDFLEKFPIIKTLYFGHKFCKKK